MELPLEFQILAFREKLNHSKKDSRDVKISSFNLQYFFATIAIDFLKRLIFHRIDLLLSTKLHTFSGCHPEAKLSWNFPETKGSSSKVFGTARPNTVMPPCFLYLESLLAFINILEKFLKFQDIKLPFNKIF